MRAEKFWLRTRREGACLIWLGATRKDRRGLVYGHVYVAGKNVQTHRYAWELEHGPIPKGLCVCHSCDVTLCIEPSHLFLGTRKQNNLDCARKWRYQQAEGHWKAKLTEREARFIRRMFAMGATRRELAARFGVAYETIKALIAGRTWKRASFEDWYDSSNTGRG